MDTPNEFLILDIGTAWTKAFLVGQDTKKPIKNSLKIPTTTEDLRFSTSILIEKIKPKTKNPKVIITSTFDEASKLTKDFNATFVSKEQVTKELNEWFVIKNFENPLLLDGGASNFLRNFKTADIGSYLSFSISETDLENFIGNKTLRLQSMPEDKNNLEIDESILRLSFGSNPDLHNPNKFNTIILTGGLFSWTPKSTRIALLLLDLMAAGKVAQIMQDDLGFLYAFGALINQKKSFKRADINFLKKSGSLVSLGRAGRVSLDYDISDVQEVTVSESEIALIPAAASQMIKLTIVEKVKREFRISGGDWGVILDGRIKPLRLQFGHQSSKEAVASWQHALDKVDLLKI